MNELEFGYLVLGGFVGVILSAAYTRVRGPRCRCCQSKPLPYCFSGHCSYHCGLYCRDTISGYWPCREAYRDALARALADPEKVIPIGGRKS